MTSRNNTSWIYEYFSPHADFDADVVKKWLSQKKLPYVWLATQMKVSEGTVKNWLSAAYGLPARRKDELKRIIEAKERFDAFHPELPHDAVIADTPMADSASFVERRLYIPRDEKEDVTFILPRHLFELYNDIINYAHYRKTIQQLLLEVLYDWGNKEITKLQVGIMQKSLEEQSFLKENLLLLREKEQEHAAAQAHEESEYKRYSQAELGFTSMSEYAYNNLKSQEVKDYVIAQSKANLESARQSYEEAKQREERLREECKKLIETIQLFMRENPRLDTGTFEIPPYIVSGENPYLSDEELEQYGDPEEQGTVPL